MLSFNHVSFGYNGNEIFSDLHFNLGNGEFCFLVGKSGAGKSTLLQLIYMNLKPASGSVQVGDYNSEIIKLKEIPYLRRRLGIVFQDFKLFKDRTVFENLAFVLHATNTPKSELYRKINNALSDVGLSHRSKAYPSELSGGEQQRVAIARAVINDPVLILADEPTGNLDPTTGKDILDIFLKINKRGTAVLFATHNYELIKTHTAKVIKLENGRAVKGVVRQKS
jgi:cell division transport system ATP-binding protein